MMKRKLCACVMTFGLLLALLGGCNQQAAPKETKAPDSAETTAESMAPETSDTVNGGDVQMWDGYYYDNSTGTDCFIRLNEDGTYYAKYFGGSVLDAGSWQLLDEELEYSTDGGADEDWNTVEDNAKATASQVVEMASYTRGTVKVAYVDDTLTDMSFGGMANHRSAKHVPDYPYNPETDETPLQIFLFYANNDIGSNLILQHDKTFTDVTGDAFLGGTWVMSAEGVYDFTYDDGTTAVLNVSQDGASAVLTYADGSELELKDDYKDASVSDGMTMMSLRADGVTVEGQPMAVNVRLDAYGDNTCQMFVEITQVGAELLVDKGTWEMSETMKPTFHFETAGDIEGVPNYETATAEGLEVSLAYKAAVSTEFNGSVVEMGIDSELAGTYAPAGIAGNGADGPETDAAQTDAAETGSSETENPAE